MGGFLESQQKKTVCLICSLERIIIHLGTRRAGMAVYSKEEGYNRAIHNIENAPFRTKFDKDVNEMHGHLGIGCISDFEPSR